MSTFFFLLWRLSLFLLRRSLDLLTFFDPDRNMDGEDFLFLTYIPYLAHGRSAGGRGMGVGYGDIIFYKIGGFELIRIT